MESTGHWINRTGLELTDELLTEYLGFIYKVTLPDGAYYYGRKQFWTPISRPPLKGKKRKRLSWAETDWRFYTTSSNEINKNISNDGNRCIRFEILAVFTSKSAIRYAEALAIIISGSYEDFDRGLNWNFAGCKGGLKFELTDRAQLEHLKKEVSNDECR